MRPELEAGFAALRGGAAVSPLADREIVAARGEDRIAFLQGMLSNDVARRQAGQGTYALLLTEQGKIVAELRAYLLADEVWLDVDAGARDGLRAALERLIVADDVELEPRGLGALALRGPRAAEVLASVSGRSWTDLAECEHQDVELAGVPVRIARVRDVGVDGFHLWSKERSALEPLTNALLAEGAEPASHEAIEAQRIVAGWARQGIDFDDRTLAPEVPSLARGISYVKGCYLGQEVVERIAARGHVNWVVAALRADVSFAAGATVHFDGQEVGRVTSACIRPDDGSLAGLARLKRSAAEPGGTVRLGNEAGSPAVVMSIPVEA